MNLDDMSDENIRPKEVVGIGSNGSTDAGLTCEDDPIDDTSSKEDRAIEDDEAIEDDRAPEIGATLKAAETGDEDAVTTDDRGAEEANRKDAVLELGWIASGARIGLIETGVLAIGSLLKMLGMKPREYVDVVKNGFPGKGFASWHSPKPT